MNPLNSRIPFESASLNGRSSFDYGSGSRKGLVRYKLSFIDEDLSPKNLSTIGGRSKIPVSILLGTIKKEQPYRIF